MDEPSLLTVSEVASRLRCHPHTVRRWIWAHRLRAVKVGDLVRVPERELARFIRAPREHRAGKKAASRPRGVRGLIDTMRRLRKKVRPGDVDELERLIAEAEAPPEVESPLA